MYQVIEYGSQWSKRHSAYKPTGRKVVGTFDDLSAAHEFAAGRKFHAVQYSRKAVKDYNA